MKRRVAGHRCPFRPELSAVVYDLRMARTGRVFIAAVACAACHSPTHSGSDDGPPADAVGGALPDTSRDASPPDADPARVFVHVAARASDGTPDPTAIVIFMDATGADLHDGTVDANGDASWDLPNGGVVTVVQATTSGVTRDEVITTIHGVKPGDHLTAGPAVNPT